ncbi:MAG: cyclic nucleotide-binding/CBS domain-containing protein [Candidatus Hydrothermarchaeales archaeon]
MFFSLLKKVKIRDAMKMGVITVAVDAPVSEVIDSLTKNDVSGIVVVDEFGETWGVVSSIDIVSALKDKTPEEIEEMTAEDVMTPQAIEIDPEKSLEDAARIMAEKGIHRLVIGHPHEGRRVPVGIVTSTDIIEEVQKEISK